MVPVVVEVPRCVWNRSESLGVRALKDFDVGKVNSGTEKIILWGFVSVLFTYTFGLLISFLIFGLFVPAVLSLGYKST
jgi:hypothetical protein